MKREEIIKKIIEYFGENTEEFNELVEALDAWNGYLGDDRVYPMEELNEIYANTEAIEILYRAFYGYDGEIWHYDKDGYKEYNAPFNPNRDYFSFNAYGNLVSYDYIDYSNRLDKYAVEEIADNLDNIDVCLTEELEELFNELTEEA